MPDEPSEDVIESPVILRDLDSAEAIEENMFSLKIRMVDITLRQQHLGEQIQEANKVLVPP